MGRGGAGSPRQGDGPPRRVVLEGAGPSRILPRRRRCRFPLTRARLRQRRQLLRAFPGVPHPSARAAAAAASPSSAGAALRAGSARGGGGVPGPFPERRPGRAPPALPQEAAAAAARGGPAARTSWAGQGGRPACGRRRARLCGPRVAPTDPRRNYPLLGVASLGGRKGETYVFAAFFKIIQIGWGFFLVYEVSRCHPSEPQKCRKLTAVTLCRSSEAQPKSLPMHKNLMYLSLC